jgi:hypothetical protein
LGFNAPAHRACTSSIRPTLHGGKSRLRRDPPAASGRLAAAGAPAAFLLSLPGQRTILSAPLDTFYP